jgi:single-stranded-DNA-specific exonuclease
MTVWVPGPPSDGSTQLPGLHPFVASALIRRGLTTPDSVQAFLDPGFYSPSSPEDLPGLPAALDRLARSIRAQEPVCVWGDFDVDGQTSTTILVQALQKVGANVSYHIPVRHSEGHGVNLPRLQEIIDLGTKLILTCDTGIAAHQAVEFARTHGVELLITDHHDLPDRLPQAAAVVDPKLLPPGHPLSTLSGSGVAYKLAEGLFSRTGHPEDAAAFLDLTVLGLVADLARLTGDARYLAQKGLEALRNTRRLGLQVMLELAGVVPANLTEEHIGFVLGPRLNALGRLGDANPAVELLTTSNTARARLLVAQLENYNAQRQLLCNQVTEAAEARLRADPSLLEGPVILLDHPAWPGGIIGIVASRLVERYHKPAILFSSPPDEPVRGSARSVEGLNITQAISVQRDLLLNFGGHPMAAGLALDARNLPEFRRRLSATVEKTLGVAAHEENQLVIDAWLPLPEVTLDLASALEALAPYGPGNEELVLASRSLALKSSAAIGRNQEHLRLVVSDELGNEQVVLWWNGAREAVPEGPFDLAFTVRGSDWRGNRQVQMEFVDFRPAPESVIEVGKQAPKVIDYRSVTDPREQLKSFQGEPSTVIWAEAEAKKYTGGIDRNELKQADTLVIWTTPPSSEDLRAALDIVRPRTIVLFAAHPTLEETELFLSRLTGLLKYAINHRGGIVSYSDLTAATAQKRATVQTAVNWLVSCGKVTLKREDAGQLWVAPGVTINDLGGAARLRMEIQSLLAETAAYRAHFKRAPKDTLLP